MKKEKPKGLKRDNGKLAFHLVDDDADAEMVAVLTFGGIVYDDGNWAHVEQALDRYYSSTRRHLRSARKGEVLDPEHGLFHLAGAACSIHFLLALELRKHPELVKSFPERFARALDVAREVRARRDAAAAAQKRPKTRSQGPGLARARPRS